MLTPPYDAGPCLSTFSIKTPVIFIDFRDSHRRVTHVRLHFLACHKQGARVDSVFVSVIRLDCRLHQEYTNIFMREHES
jgi:hypothetical protein